MAGDWLKFECTLPEKPEVWQIAGILAIDPDAVVGKLMKVWRWFDAHTENGNAAGVTYALVDSITGVTGFAEAMALCGWLVQDGSSLVCPNFDRNNGKTSKNRALTAKRAASHRGKSNAKSNDASVTSALPREEKRREEKKEDQKTGADAPGVDPKKKFWDYVIAVCGGGEQTRKRIGKLSKDFGEEAVMKALAEAAMRSPADPIGYAAKVIQKSESNPWDGAI